MHEKWLLMNLPSCAIGVTRVGSIARGTVRCLCRPCWNEDVEVAVHASCHPIVNGAAEERVAIAKKNRPAKMSIAPIVTGSMRPRSLWLLREESAVVARSLATYVCEGPSSLALS